MKTLHLTNCWHPESGGISTFYRELLRQAENERRQIRLVVPGEADGVERHGKYGLIYRVHGRPSKLSPGYRMIMPASYLLPGGRVRKILAAERPEIVECCDKYTLNLSRRPAARWTARHSELSPRRYRARLRAHG